MKLIDIKQLSFPDYYSPSSFFRSGQRRISNLCEGSHGLQRISLSSPSADTVNNMYIKRIVKMKNENHLVRHFVVSTELHGPSRPVMSTHTLSLAVREGGRKQ